MGADQKLPFGAFGNTRCTLLPRGELQCTAVFHSTLAKARQAWKKAFSAVRQSSVNKEMSGSDKMTTLQYPRCGHHRLQASSSFLVMSELKTLVVAPASFSADWSCNNKN